MQFVSLRTLTFLRIFRSRFTEDVCFLLAITLSAGFYFYEKRLPYTDVIAQVSAAAVIVIWLWLSFTSGFMRRICFAVFLMTYWLLPQIIIFGYNTSSNYDPFLHSLSRASELLVRSPLELASRAADINVFISGIILLALCLMMFTLGFLYRNKCREYRWYRIFRDQYNV